MAGGDNLRNAKKAKNDEFYTQLSDIENELKHYKEHFKDKVVFCNCDDPYESNFFQYFVLNFNHLELKKLITTSYSDSAIANKEFLISPEKSYKVTISYLEDMKDKSSLSKEELKAIIKPRARLLRGGGATRQTRDKTYYLAGDFRSAECVELLKQADIVVTNPPFSLFREYVAQLIEYDKKFLIIGSLNAISYKEIFPLIKDNKLWLGHGFKGGNAYFKSVNLREFASGVYDENTGLVKFRNCAWFTNLDIKKRHEELDLYKKYNPQEYPKYDNYDAIDISYITDIPCDYYGVMGVPITFLDKYNPEQFELIGLGTGNLAKEIGITKNYRGRTDLAITKNGKSNCPYNRILIKRIKNEN
ncbi:MULTISPECIES: adenine-specific methyltransferase EcoRI family protein [Campylobacter]|uniref:adenine-specific methyltransferase EcoRI family protein n=1 Tax=Campylobacter TaxID=194 RepID=UPI000A343049|nr:MULTISPECIES: adenine-specific methyltransferase EcoRI family protein [unclassified Campylobacter]